MEEKINSIAKRTRAQIKCQFEKMTDEYYKKKQKEKKGKSEKAYESHAMNAIEGKKTEELESSKVTRNDEEIIGISNSSNDEEQKGKNVNQNIFNRKMDGTVKKIFNDDKNNGSDVRILGQKEVVAEVNLKEFNRIRRKRIVIANKMNKRGRKTITKGKNNCNDDDVVFNDCDDDDVVLLTEEDVPPNLRCNYVRGRKQFPSKEKRGRSDRNKANERINIESEPLGNGAKKKGKGLLIENLDANDFDKDYGEEELESSDTQSNHCGYCSENNLEGGIGKHDGKINLSERCYIKEREYSEDVGILEKSMKDNRNEDSIGRNVGSESSSRKRKLHGNLRDDEVVTSRLSCRRPWLHSTPKFRKQSECGTSSKHTLKNDDQTKKNLFSFEGNSPTHMLPLKFRFDDENPALLEKEDWQKEIDTLFTEMEICLILLDSDITESSMDGTHHVTTIAKSQVELCLLGQHQLILEEPIGNVCRCCHIVYTEMKDILPALKKKTPRR